MSDFVTELKPLTIYHSVQFPRIMETDISLYLFTEQNVGRFLTCQLCSTLKITNYAIAKCKNRPQG